MRASLLLTLAVFSLAACDSPYGKDFSKADSQSYDVSTGSHIRGAASSAVQTSSGAALDSVTKGNGASAQVSGAGH